MESTKIAFIFALPHSYLKHQKTDHQTTIVFLNLMQGLGRHLQWSENE